MNNKSIGKGRAIGGQSSILRAVCGRLLDVSY